MVRSWSKSEGNIRSDIIAYKSSVVDQQNLIIGYVKYGVMYPGESYYQQLKGTYVLKAQDKGEYFIYLLSASSDYKP